MNRLKLVAVNESHKEIMMNDKNEFMTSGDRLEGTSGLSNALYFKTEI